MRPPSGAIHVPTDPDEPALAALMKSGEFEKLYRKWFESPIPPKGINLQAPMSQELKDNMKAMSDKPAT